MITNETTPRTELQQLMDDYCDYHKDVHGVKARWIYNSGVTVAELKSMLASLEREYHEQAESERKHTERKGNVGSGRWWYCSASNPEP